MTEARPRNYREKVHGSPEDSQAESRWNSTEDFPPAPASDQVDRLLNLRDIQTEFGLSIYAIYGAVQRGQLHALRRDGKGRTYYAEWEVRAFLSLLFDLGTAA